MFRNRGATMAPMPRISARIGRRFLRLRDSVIVSLGWRSGRRCGSIAAGRRRFSSHHYNECLFAVTRPSPSLDLFVRVDAPELVLPQIAVDVAGVVEHDEDPAPRPGAGL